MGDLKTALPVLSVFLVVVLLLYRRFRRTASDVPWACHATAAIALCLGVMTAMAGVGHSVAVASLALKELEYGPLQILHFTTGAMLMYSGAMNAAVHRGIRAGRR